MGLTKGQQDFVDTFDRPLVVAAGAGSGKTLTLTQRIVHAFETGAVNDVDEVLAITFTEKAAAELRSRVRAALRASGRIDQALKVDDAWISTIHGMCSRILHAHALELGIDLNFTVGMDEDVKRWRDEAVNEVLSHARASSDERTSALFCGYRAGSSGNSFRAQATVASMIDAFMDAASSSPKGMDAVRLPPAGESPVVMLLRAIDAFEQLVPAVKGYQDVKFSDERAAWLASAPDTLARVRGASQEEGLDAQGALAALGELTVPKQQGSAEFREAVRRAKDVIVDCALALGVAAGDAHLETVRNLASRALEAFRARKRAAGVLDNDDLLVGAWCALAQHPDILARYAGRFKLVMVDEFQDTDRLQIDMIKRLAGRGYERLAVVGDPQQSIYRFRGADVSVFMGHRLEVERTGTGRVVELPDNFRSHGDVLRLVDCVFTRDDMFGGNFMHLDAKRDESLVKAPFLDDGPRVYVELVSGAKAKADALAKVDAQLVARRFAEFRESGHSAGDMVVLLGGMKRAGVYAEALRARGLSCVISGGSVFNGTYEAALVGSLLALMANATDNAALYNALASPMFALSTGELLALVTSYDDAGTPHRVPLSKGFARASARLSAHAGEECRRNTAVRVDEAAMPRLAVAVRALSRMTAPWRGASVAERLRAVIAASGWLARLEQAGPEGLASAGNLYKALRIVDDLERKNAVGAAALAHLYENKLAISKEAPGALSVSGGDFVRIMTVHASKGLEFPIVAVAEFRDNSRPSGKFISLSFGGNMHVSCNADASVAHLAGLAKPAIKDADAALRARLPEDADEDELVAVADSTDDPLTWHAALREMEYLGDSEESKRLLYVALTRAEEALVVACRGRDTKANPNGYPKNVLKAVLDGLDPQQKGFEVGVTMRDYGGERPAEVEHVEVGKDGKVHGLDETAGALESTPGNGRQDSHMIELFAPEEPPRASDVPYRRCRSNVFSYSSLAEGSRESGLATQLANAYAVSCDEADGASQIPDVSPATDWAASTQADAFSVGLSNSRHVVVVGASGEGAEWADSALEIPDADKATNFGNAFHRLAQYAVLARRGKEKIAMPLEERIDAISRACGLPSRHRTRLMRALDCWTQSDVAADMASLDLQPEVPFFIDLPAVADAAGELPSLEGQIDLFGAKAGWTSAWVVDYKTGGADDETSEQLKRKHALQAACYAYTVLQQGFQEVEATFVRVEHRSAGKPCQPQCVHYQFYAGDKPDLEAAIVQAMKASREHV